MRHHSPKPGKPDPLQQIPYHIPHTPNCKSRSQDAAELGLIGDLGPRGPTMFGRCMGMHATVCLCGGKRKMTPISLSMWITVLLHFWVCFESICAPEINITRIRSPLTSLWKEYILNDCGRAYWHLYVFPKGEPFGSHMVGWHYLKQTLSCMVWNKHFEN